MRRAIVLTLGSVLAAGSAIASSHTPAMATIPCTETAHIFCVTNTDDSGPGTLRDAIARANDPTNGGALNQIGFNIPGTPPYSIHPANCLPALTAPVTIDGTTQDGSNGLPLVEISGPAPDCGIKAIGLDIEAPSTTIRGVVVNGFSAPNVTTGSVGIAVNASGTHPSLPGVVIAGDYIGTDVTGESAAPNETGIEVDAHGVVIGGAAPTDRNVIAGNSSHDIAGFPCGGLQIQGNFIGLDATGERFLSLGPLHGGVSLDPGGSPGCSRSLLGGAALTPGEPPGNVIAEDAALGYSGGAPWDVEGNLFWTDVTGASVPVGAEDDPAQLVIGGNDSMIGGTDAADRNVIGAGVVVSGAKDVQILNNYVGTDASGMHALSSSSNSSNDCSAVQLGVRLKAAEDAVVGAPGGGNIIAGLPASCGVGVDFASGHTLIQSNWIGLNVAGQPLGNAAGGISIGGVGVVVGGTTLAEANIIANNHGPGVFVQGDSTGSTHGDSILRNAIYDNDGLGIKLCIPSNPTDALCRLDYNDPLDADEGPNHLQNAPIITSVDVGGATTTIGGSLNSEPDMRYHIEFFRNDACDPSHFGEGQEFLGSEEVTTDAQGEAPLPPLTISRTLSSTDAVTATATAPDGSTSQFSECLADLEVTKTDSPDPVQVGTPLTYTLTVMNHGPAPATNVKLTDDLPAGVTFGSANSPDGDCAGPDASLAITCSFDEIGRGDLATATIVVTPTETGTIENTATVSGEETDPDPANNEASEPTSVGVSPPPGALVIAKRSLGGTDSFGFTSTGGLPTPADASGNFTISTVGSNPNQATFADLAAERTYTVAEPSKTGWDLTGLSCSGATDSTVRYGSGSTFTHSSWQQGDSAAQITVAAGETVTCTFEDAKRASITVSKYGDTNRDGQPEAGEPSLPGWTFFIDLNNNGVKDPNETTTGVTDQSGRATFSNLLPGASYRICEVLQGGWVNTDPGSNAQPCKTTGTLSVGQAASLQFGNTAALNSGAKTMGFWRNKNGQSIITGGCLGADKKAGTADDLVSFLRQYNPFMDLASTATCSQIGTYVTNTVNGATKTKINDPSNLNAMLKAQMLATALDVYFSSAILGGNKIGAPSPIGDLSIDLEHMCRMFDYVSGTAVCIGIEDATSAFNQRASLTVSQMLSWASSQASQATAKNPLASPWYGQDKALQGLAKDSFDAVNNNVAFGP